MGERPEVLFGMALCRQVMWSQPPNLCMPAHSLLGWVGPYKNHRRKAAPRLNPPTWDGTTGGSAGLVAGISFLPLFLSPGQERNTWSPTMSSAAPFHSVQLPYSWHNPGPPAFSGEGSARGLIGIAWHEISWVQLGGSWGPTPVLLYTIN